MFKYCKKLEYPINITKKDLAMAKYIITALGGSAGELAAATRYFVQSFSMPDERGKALLVDIATEELAHVEMISTMFKQLIKDATPEELINPLLFLRQREVIHYNRFKKLYEEYKEKYNI